MSVAVSTAPDEASVVSKALLRAAGGARAFVCGAGRDHRGERVDLVAHSQSQARPDSARQQGRRAGALVSPRVPKPRCPGGWQRSACEGLAPRRESSRGGRSAWAHEEDRGAGRCR